MDGSYPAMQDTTGAYSGLSSTCSIDASVSPIDQFNASTSASSISSSHSPRYTSPASWQYDLTGQQTTLPPAQLRGESHPTTERSGWDHNIATRANVGQDLTRLYRTQDVLQVPQNTFQPQQDIALETPAVTGLSRLYTHPPTTIRDVQSFQPFGTDHHNELKSFTVAQAVVLRPDDNSQESAAVTTVPRLLSNRSMTIYDSHQRSQIAQHPATTHATMGAVPAQQQTAIRCQCDLPGCSKTFKRAADLQRHKDTCHRLGGIAYECGDSSCAFGNRRYDKVKAHCDKYQHGAPIATSAQTWEAKRARASSSPGTVSLADKCHSCGRKNRPSPRKRHQ